MPEVVKILDGADIIHVVSSGLVTPEDLEASRESILRMAKGAGFRKVLVDVSRIEQLTSSLDAFSHTYAISRNDSLRAVRHAVVHAGNMPELFHLLEDAAVKRGMEWKTFSQEQEALTWLNEG